MSATVSIPAELRERPQWVLWRCVELDDCITDDGEIESWAAEIVEQLDSYTERSPSETGAHIFVKAKLNGSRRRSGGFEVYDERRFFCMTGESLGARETV